MRDQGHRPACGMPCACPPLTSCLCGVPLQVVVWHRNAQLSAQHGPGTLFSAPLLMFLAPQDCYNPQDDVSSRGAARGQLGGSWGAVGEQLGSSWGAAGEQLGSSWGAAGGGAGPPAAACCRQAQQVGRGWVRGLPAPSPPPPASHIPFHSPAPPPAAGMAGGQVLLLARGDGAAARPHHGARQAHADALRGGRWAAAVPRGRAGVRSPLTPCACPCAHPWQSALAAPRVGCSARGVCGLGDGPCRWPLHQQGRMHTGVGSHVDGPLQGRMHMGGWMNDVRQIDGPALMLLLPLLMGIHQGAAGCCCCRRPRLRCGGGGGRGRGGAGAGGRPGQPRPAAAAARSAATAAASGGGGGGGGGTAAAAAAGAAGRGDGGGGPWRSRRAWC